MDVLLLLSILPQSILKVLFKKRTRTLLETPANQGHSALRFSRVGSRFVSPLGLGRLGGCFPPTPSARSSAGASPARASQSRNRSRPSAQKAMICCVPCGFPLTPTKQGVPSRKTRPYTCWCDRQGMRNENDPDQKAIPDLVSSGIPFR